ncbi:MAG: hypothetical protein ABIE23_01030 [archaeon]|nr:hypothetical protein [Candidatus Micrarchaeota archaeon]
MEDKFGIIIWENSHSGLIRFYLKLGRLSEKKKGEIFLTSAGLIKKVEQKKLNAGWLGHCFIRVKNDEKTIQWDEFFPFGQKHSKNFRGFGTLVTAAIVTRLKKTYPGYLVYVGDAFKPRRKQLEKIGIEIKRYYPIEEYHKLIVGYSREMLKRHPLMPKPKKPLIKMAGRLISRFKLQSSR